METANFYIEKERKAEIIKLVESSNLSDTDKNRLIEIVEYQTPVSDYLLTGIGGATYIAGQTGMRDDSTREMAIQRELSILYDNLRSSNRPSEQRALNSRIRKLEAELEETQRSYQRSRRLRNRGAFVSGLGAAKVAYDKYKYSKV